MKRQIRPTVVALGKYWRHEGSGFQLEIGLMRWNHCCLSAGPNLHHLVSTVHEKEWNWVRSNQFLNCCQPLWWTPFLKIKLILAWKFQFTTKHLQKANCKIPVARWGSKTSWILSFLLMGSTDILHISKFTNLINDVILQLFTFGLKKVVSIIPN